MRDFLWNSKRPQISLEKLQQPKNLGGLALVNFRVKDDALKVAWLQILENDDFAKSCAMKTLKVKIGSNIWRCNLNKSDIKSVFQPSFWRDVLLAWSKINYNYPSTQEEICKQIIWYNSFLRVKNKPFYF